MPDLMKKQTLKHEIEHAQNGDFESCLPVELIEATNNAEADLNKVCWIGRDPTAADMPDKIARIMSNIVDGGKIISIPPKG
jgi:hypothetical protein